MPLIPQHIRDLEPYKAGKTIEELRQEYQLEKIIKLASNENPRGASPLAVKAIIASMDSIHRYPPTASYALRQALADRFELMLDNVIVGHGSEGIMSLILRTFMLDDEEALTSEGTFIGFRVLAQSRGIKLRTVPLKNYRIDLDAIAENINQRTKIIYLANPNNPTGMIFTVREFLKFKEKVPPKVLVIMDEAYFEYAHYDPTFPDSMQYRLDNVITLRTFSKAYGLAGVRIGYGFAHENLIINLMKVKLPFEPSIPAMAAGLAAMQDLEFLEKSVKLNELGLEFFYSIFDQLGIFYLRSHANFVTFVLDSETAVNTLFDRLLRLGVIVRPLKAFGLPNAIRVSTGLEEENEIFAQALKKSL